MEESQSDIGAYQPLSLKQSSGLQTKRLFEQVPRLTTALSHHLGMCKTQESD
jgi:hypothetical protein